MMNSCLTAKEAWDAEGLEHVDPRCPLQHHLVFYILVAASLGAGAAVAYLSKRALNSRHALSAMRLGKNSMPFQSCFGRLRNRSTIFGSKFRLNQSWRLEARCRIETERVCHKASHPPCTHPDTPGLRRYALVNWIQSLLATLSCFHRDTHLPKPWGELQIFLASLFGRHQNS